MISLTSPVKTRAHHWPAGPKLGVLALATLLLFRVESLAILSLVFLLVCTAYALPGRVFFGVGLRRLWGLWPFVVLIVLWHWWEETYAQGAQIVLRMLIAVALANLVTMTTPLSAMMAVVEKLLSPLRWVGLSTRPVTVAMALVIRFVPVLADKGVSLRLAWRARARGRPGWRLIEPYAVAAIDDAEQVALALRARGGL